MITIGAFGQKRVEYAEGFEDGVVLGRIFNVAKASKLRDSVPNLRPQ